MWDIAAQFEPWCKGRKTGYHLYYIEIRRKCCFAADEMLTYFTCFSLFTQLGVHKVWAKVVFNKNKLSKCTMIGDKQLQKRNVATLIRYIKQKKQCSTTLIVVGWNDSMAVYVYSSEYSKPKRFVRRSKKIERKYIQKQ